MITEHCTSYYCCTSAEQQPFIALADALLTGHRALHAAAADFAALLRAELGLSAPLTGKLVPAQEWKPWSTALQKKPQARVHPGREKRVAALPAPTAAGCRPPAPGAIG